MFLNDNSGKWNIWLILIISTIILGANFMVGGLFTSPSTLSQTPLDERALDTNTSEVPHNNLQLSTLKFKSCGQTAAVDFLIDNSGSMRFGEKMPSLKQALHLFGSSFPDNGVLGMQVYSDSPSEALPFSLYKDAKNQFSNAVEGMFPDSATFSKDAFIFAQERLEKARLQFPKHKFALIFISDGIPETSDANTDCVGGPNGPTCGLNIIGTCRCFDANQDPTSIAAQIKQSGIRIFTIAYTDSSDAKFNTLLQNMMQNVASSPSDFYTAPFSEQLANIITQISTKICKE